MSGFHRCHLESLFSQSPAESGWRTVWTERILAKQRDRLISVRPPALCLKPMSGSSVMCGGHQRLAIPRFHGATRSRTCSGTRPAPGGASSRAALSRFARSACFFAFVSSMQRVLSLSSLRRTSSISPGVIAPAHSTRSMLKTTKLTSKSCSACGRRSS